MMDQPNSRIAAIVDRHGPGGKRFRTLPPLRQPSGLYIGVAAGWARNVTVAFLGGSEEKSC
jgi:hypothetical protein